MCDSTPRGVPPTAIHSCGRTGGETTPEPPDATQAPSGSPLGSGPDLCRTRPSRSCAGRRRVPDRCGRPRVHHPDPDSGRLGALPTELEDTFSAGEIAHAAPQVAPGPGDVALVQTPGVGLLLVQEAIGESVLAVEVRGH